MTVTGTTVPSVIFAVMAGVTVPFCVASTEIENVGTEDSLLAELSPDSEQAVITRKSEKAVSRPRYWLIKVFFFMEKFLHI